MRDAARSAADVRKSQYYKLFASVEKALCARPIGLQDELDFYEMIRRLIEDYFANKSITEALHSCYFMTAVRACHKYPPLFFIKEENSADPESGEHRINTGFRPMGDSLYCILCAQIKYECMRALVGNLSNWMIPWNVEPNYSSLAEALNLIEEKLMAGRSELIGADLLAVGPFTGQRAADYMNLTTLMHNLQQRRIFLNNIKALQDEKFDV